MVCPHLNLQVLKCLEYNVKVHCTLLFHTCHAIILQLQYCGWKAQREWRLGGVEREQCPATAEKLSWTHELKLSVCVLQVVWVLWLFLP